MINYLKKKINDYNAKRELEIEAPILNENAKELKAQGVVNLIFSERWERFFWIKQIHFEILGLTQAVEKLNPKVIVEVGTNMGGSLFCFTKVATSDALIISVDLPDGMGGGGYPLYRSDFYKSFATNNQKMHLLRENSHDDNTLNKVKQILGNQKIDFLFLDGDHSYEGIKQDFEMYSPLVRSGGLVGFHDIKPSLPDNWRQVGPFWEELKRQYKHEIFWDDSLSWGGIGVVVIP